MLLFYPQKKSPAASLIEVTAARDTGTELSASQNKCLE